MATRLYTRGTTAPIGLTAGDKSTALPVGSDGGDFNQGLALLLTTQATQTDYTYSSLAQLTQQSAMIARHSSAALKAQTIDANTWTLLFEGNESDIRANAFLAISLYVWRPSTSSVVGFIIDSATTLGIEFDGTNQTVTFSGSQVTAAAGDILVLEAWNVATQAKGISYTITWSVGRVATGVDSYLETPQNLSFLGFSQAFIID